LLGHTYGIVLPRMGRRLMFGSNDSLSATPWRIHRPARRLDEHNTAIYGGELGLSDTEIATLQCDGII
jgi:crotonobetainyl-CoA:carnitine CoA-transferase CaiB-like acyl-CoA transferase